MYINKTARLINWNLWINFFYNLNKVSSKPGCEFGNQDRSRILIMSVSKLPTQAWILRVNMICIDTCIFSCCACQILVHVLGMSELGTAFDSYIVGGEICYETCRFSLRWQYMTLHSFCMDNWQGEGWYFTLTAPGFYLVDATNLCVLDILYCL